MKLSWTRAVLLDVSSEVPSKSIPASRLESIAFIWGLNHLLWLRSRSSRFAHVRGSAMSSVAGVSPFVVVSTVSESTSAFLFTFAVARVLLIPAISAAVSVLPQFWHTSS